MQQDKIMIVDNEMEIVQLIRLALSKEGYDIVWTTDSTKAIELAKNENPNLILLDIVMPGINGVELCDKIRDFSDSPIMLISCKDQELDKVLGLSMGADDYLTKPFSTAELVARVKAHLRRNHLSRAAESPSYNPNVLSIGHLEINLNAHVVLFKEETLNLTASEFKLLATMAREPNRVFTQSQLYENMWMHENDYDDLRPIMVHISNLRKKLGEEGKGYIQTVRGVGYKLAEPIPAKK